MTTENTTVDPPRCGHCGMRARVRQDNGAAYVDCSWDRCATAGPLRPTQAEAVQAWTERFTPEWSGTAERCGYCGSSAQVAFDEEGYSIECSSDGCAAAGPVRPIERAAKNAWSRPFIAQTRIP